MTEVAEVDSGIAISPTDKLIEAMARASDPWLFGPLSPCNPTDLKWMDQWRTSAVGALKLRTRAALTALRQAEAEAGWRLVPLEPTSDMICAAYDAWTEDGAFEPPYRAALRVAPKPPGAE